MCARALPVRSVGLALMTDDGPAGTVAATDGSALELEELQFSLGEGPCVDASQSGRPVLQPDLGRTAQAPYAVIMSGLSRTKRQSRSVLAGKVSEPTITRRGNSWRSIS
jgi:hypothetical protein